MTRATHDPSARRPRGPEDVWVDGPDGRFWGSFGAAGLLVAHDDAVLLQLRAEWSHFGGTWGIPGGARKSGETAEQAALREADEEAGVPPESVRVLDELVFDLGYWSYTTVLARVGERFTPIVGDAESLRLDWVDIAAVDALPLHPSFAASWPELRRRLG
ncbi:NUDIX domain-containing protein [Schumannella sp. 10F1B-5-1]|uniref:NUDIX domain-containing protein n=1 Tax=Schumannella sp. 10F1B-5-1 TaxID=2590780 RepID=UPI0011306C70|nr:NUDIX domain-containing protein [Schumannella sp. 10F1B-5-1]TPW73774.1 NUDIX domain-containing protein [Schumannella sp. 10F1B-5-1]